MEFLGIIVSKKGMEKCKDKVETIQEWPIPKTIKEIQAFLGFANFYHQLIQDYSRVAILLTMLI